MRYAACLAVAVAVTGCGAGGASPELYALVLNTVAIPASCFQTPPTDTVNKGPLGTTNVTVFDGAENKAFLNPDTTLTFDMGDAPTVSVTSSQVMEGTSGASGWTFVAETDVTDVTTVLGNTRSVNLKTRAEVVFQRATTSTGTFSLSSSSTCTGSGCGTTMPTCALSGSMRVTRLAVDFQRPP